MSVPEITVKATTNNGGTWHDVTIGGVTIIGCQRKQGSGAKGPYDFVSLPQRQYTARSGETKYARIIMLDKDTEEAVRAAVKAYDAGEGTSEGEYPPDETTDLEPF